MPLLLPGPVSFRPAFHAAASPEPSPVSGTGERDINSH